MRARDIMTCDIITVPVNTTISDLCRLLHQHHITGAPVVDEGGELVGIVSEKDLVTAEVQSIQGDPSYSDIHELFSSRFMNPEGANVLTHRHNWVEDIMTRDVITAVEDTDVTELCRLMVDSHIHRIPILRERKIVGIVSSMDVLRVISEDPHYGGA